MDLDQAITKHAEWKLKFRGAMAKHEQMDASAISQDNQCELGKWLHGEAKSKYAALESYKKLVTKHAGFHKEAGKVAGLINAKHYDSAEKELGAGTAYSSASQEVGVAIMALKKEAKI